MQNDQCYCDTVSLNPEENGDSDHNNVRSESMILLCKIWLWSDLSIAQIAFPNKLNLSFSDSNSLGMVGVWC